MLNLDNIKNWLASDAAPGWIFGFVTLFVVIISGIWKYSRRKRPNIIICRELDKITLVKINKKIKEDISIEYKRSKIENLAQVNIEFSNTGTSTVNDAEIKIHFDKKTKILGVASTNRTPDITGKWKISNNLLTSRFKYLNCYQDHKSKALISILCDGNVDSIKFEGGGEAWSIKHIKLPSKRDYIVRFILVSLILLLEMSVLSIINKRNFFVFQKSDILFLPLFLVTYVFGYAWAIPTFKSKHLSGLVSDLKEVSLSLFRDS